MVKIVVTNDDGYDQPGLTALVQAARTLGQVHVVAPATPQSNVAHKVTLRETIRVDRPDSGTHVVHATPADCSRLAIKELVPDADWLFAGINPGANLGSDVYQSGTVAAAREAAILGVRAVAISQYLAPDWTVDWFAVQAQATRCLTGLMKAPLAAGQYWNINLPSPLTADDPVDVLLCPLDTSPHRYRYVRQNGGFRYRGIIHDRPQMAGRDVEVCFGGRISATRLEI